MGDQPSLAGGNCTSSPVSNPGGNFLLFCKQGASCMFWVETWKTCSSSVFKMLGEQGSLRLEEGVNFWTVTAPECTWVSLWVVFWCGFFFFPPYQQYIACINEFMTYEPIILFPGLYKVKSNEGNAPQQHPIAYTTVRPAWTRRARRRLALTLGFYQSKKYSEKPNFGVWGLAAALPCTSRWLCAIPGVRAGPGLCSPARAQPRAEIT